MVNQLFGNYLVQAGMLTSDQLERAFETQNKVRVKLGLIAVTEKLMTLEQSEEVNKLQAVMDKRFGDIAIEKGYLSSEQVSRLLGLQGNQYLTFAQAVTDNGFMTLKEFENAFSEYQRKLSFTSTDMDALKSGDSDRIVPLFLPSGCDGLQVEQVLVAVRTLLRLIDSDAYIGSASRISSVTAKGSALQCLKGDRSISLAVVGDKDAILSLAGVFAREEFDSIDEDSLDSVAEFINCVNGLFATGVASKVNLDMLPPVFKEEEVTLTGDNILQLPVFINGKELQILSTIDGVIEA
jgi:CheY-specific phosphatase CheX